MKRKQIKFRDAKGELREALNKEQNLKIEEEPAAIQEKLIDNEKHEKEDHYHGIHHFDKYGHHDDISKSEFSIKSQFPKSKRALTFRIAMAGLVLAVAIACSAIDMTYEDVLVVSLNIEVRFIDLTIILVGLPIVGLVGTIGIAVVEPWFHWLIDSTHLVQQIAFDSVGYVIAVVVFYCIFYLLFRNSPIHKDPNPKKEWFKEIMPGVIIVPLLAVIFTVLAWIVSYFTHLPAVITAAWIFTEFGIQCARFLVIYIFFVVIERVMKPVNHRYR